MFESIGRYRDPERWLRRILAGCATSLLIAAVIAGAIAWWLASLLLPYLRLLLELLWLLLFGAPVPMLAWLEPVVVPEPHFEVHAIELDYVEPAEDVVDLDLPSLEPPAPPEPPERPERPERPEPARAPSHDEDAVLERESHAVLMFLGTSGDSGAISSAIFSDDGHTGLGSLGSLTGASDSESDDRVVIGGVLAGPVPEGVEGGVIEGSIVGGVGASIVGGGGGSVVGGVEGGVGLGSTFEPPRWKRRPEPDVGDLVGSCRVRVVVAPSGRPGEITFVSCDEPLRDPVREAISRARLHPATDWGEPVSGTIVTTWHFE